MALQSRHGTPRRHRGRRPRSARRRCRGLNDKPGVCAGARQAVLTALDVLGYERPTSCASAAPGLVGLVVPELDNPIFPAFAQVIESTLAQQATPRCCAPRPPAASPRTSTSRCCSTAGQRHRLRLRPARRHHRRPRPLPQLIARPLPIVLINGFAAGSTRRSSPATTAPATWPCPPGRARPPAHRPDLRPGPVPAGAAQARRLPRRDDAAARHHRRRADALVVAVTVRCGGRRRRRRPAAGPRRHRHRLRLGPDGARRDPRGPAPGCRARGTSRWSASTTRR